jgi:hypothetical protein
VPTASTKDRPGLERPDGESGSRLERVRRRLAEGYYDRVEIRRTVARLLLRRLAGRPARAGSAHPETA